MYAIGSKCGLYTQKQLTEMFPHGGSSSCDSLCFLPCRNTRTCMSKDMRQRFQVSTCPNEDSGSFSQSCPTRFQNLGTNHNRTRHIHSMWDLDGSSCRLGKQCRSPHMSWTPAQFNCKAVIPKDRSRHPTHRELFYKLLCASNR
jgi:hypothetical protein